MIAVVKMEGWVYALIAVVVWGFEAIIVRAAGDGVDPLVGTGIGCIAAGLVFAVYLGATGRINSDMLNRTGFYYGIAGVTSFAIGHTSITRPSTNLGHLSAPVWLLLTRC